MLTTSELKSLLRKHGLRLTKRLGQHHLVDPRVVTRLVERCELSSEETVVEIGAGLGALTESLAERARLVVAVEVDRGICALLRERLAAQPRVEVVCGDILEFSWERTMPIVVVGAIPYSITSPILVSLSEHRRAIRRALLIVQEEVAKRLLARPGTKAYGRLSVLGQYGWQITQVMPIPRSAFFPEPGVDSVCVKLTPRVQPAVAVEDEEGLFALVKAAFAHRRKSLVNCLTRVPGISMTRRRVEEAISELGLPTSVRGETLSLEEFARLSRALWSPTGSPPRHGSGR